jgi:hypothetical protein
MHRAVHSDLVIPEAPAFGARDSLSAAGKSRFLDFVALISE